MIHVYIGDGKGKTSAALGLALRAAGYGKRVYIAQFLKDKKFPSGEIAAIEKYFEPLTIERFECQVHPMFAKGTALTARQVKDSVRKALLKIQHSLTAKEFDVYVLDEVLNALAGGFCSERALGRIIENAAHVELVMTGRTAPHKIITSSDYVSIIKKCRHPFDKRVSARKGIDY